MITVFAVAVAVVVAVLVRAYRQVDERFVGAWADAHALRLTPENRPMVGGYLRNARVLRTWGGLGGLLLAPIVLASLGFDLRSSVWIWVFLGYLVGA
ncbi:MAG: hypothetical protein ABIP03_13735, partial [Aquihabitans sp.]